MHSFTGSGTEATLRAFAKSIKGIPSELGKREQFSSLLGTLFRTRLRRRCCSADLKPA